jgi:hypothetical protein
MTVASFERDVFYELKEILKKPNFRKYNFTEWRTSEFMPPDGEKVVWCPRNGVWASYRE